MTIQTAPAPRTPRLLAGTAFSLGGMSEGRILALAAASPPDTTDPVDLAAAASLKVNYPKLAVPQVDPEDVDPATRTRRYSIVRVRDYAGPDGEVSDVAVIKGDIDAVLDQVRTGPDRRSVLKRNAAVMTRRGWRPLAVASAPVGANDEVGDFTVQGFVPVCPETIRPSAEGVSTGPAVFARVNVWSASLRIQHWSNVILIFLLSCTGFYIMDPFFGPLPTGGQNTGFLMGWVRFTHFVCAFLWLIVGLTRIWSASTSRDRYLRWPNLWPLKKGEDVRNFGRILQHYVFIKKDAPLYLAHNPLQQLAYTAVYIAAGCQMLVGFMLFGLYHQTNAFWAFISTPTHWFGIGTTRAIHVGIMFALWMFVIAHIYLVFRADSLERHGGLSAMISGGVWVKRGAKPVDAPVVE